MNPKSPKTLAALDAAIARAKADEAASKKKAPEWRDRRSGQYTHNEDWERQCVCGHALGNHAAESSGGMRPCFSSDITHVDCPCEKFRQKIAKGQKLYTKLLKFGEDEP
jgi:hypothetical protein